MRLSIPTPSLVVLVGAAGCGKSTFARRHFRGTEVLSSDRFRAMVADDEAAQWATPQAFELLHLIARMRLALGRLTVVDATSTRAASREGLLAIARESGVDAVAVVLDLDEEVCLARNRGRVHRQVPEAAIREMITEVRESIPLLAGEGFREVHVLRGEEPDRLEGFVRVPREGAPGG